MKKEEISESDKHLLEEVEKLITENEILITKNLERVIEIREINGNLEISSSNFLKKFIKKFFLRISFFLFGSIFARQNEINVLLSNTIQDIIRLQRHLADRAYLQTNIAIREYMQAGVNYTERLTNRELQFLYNIINNPVYMQDSEDKRIIQIVSTLNFGDAVGNDVLAIKRALKESGYRTAIFAESIHERINDIDVFPLSFLPELQKEDVIIYHFANADPFSYKLAELNCKKILRYHNITPPNFFHGFDQTSALIGEQGLQEVKNLVSVIEYGLIDSEFNKKDLISMGYKCKLDVVPILIPFSDYDKLPDASVIKRYKDGKTNILFVGRGAPNKKIEDVIRIFSVYKKKYDLDARLFLVGKYEKNSKYYNYLQNVIEEENVKDVIFPGHISFEAILAYYQIANVFVCMSEHEGFCVPLVEAMYFDVPIIAYDSSAVPDTLQGSGVLVNTKDPLLIAEEIHKIISDQDYAMSIIKEERKRLQDFQYATIKEQIINLLRKLK